MSVEAIEGLAQRCTWRHATVAARFLCGSIHVRRSYEWVAGEATLRAATFHPGDRRVRAAVTTAFLITHRRNRLLYNEVMRGH